MPLNDAVSFTWVGHGTWKVRSAAGKEILIDPWVMNNPVAPENLKRVESLDLMLITHGHYDHIWDALEIAQQTGCTVHAVFETCMWLNRKGLEKLDGGNIGGTHEIDGIKVTLVHAEHTCGISDPPAQMNNIVYGGAACGLVIEFENGFTVYFAGDTDVFGDMRLIADLHRLDAAFLPIRRLLRHGPPAGREGGGAAGCEDRCADALWDLPGAERHAGRAAAACGPGRPGAGHQAGGLGLAAV